MFELINGNNKDIDFKNKSNNYINFDNAATTPPFKKVLDDISSFLPNYSSIHRGTGIKSKISSAVYEDSRKVMGAFVNYNPQIHSVIFTQNTTHSFNLLAHSLNLTKEDIVIISEMEHHSNDLPWRKAKVLYAPLNEDGSLNLDELNCMIEKNKERLKVVTISAASNVSGIINPIEKIAKSVHKVNALIAVDLAQYIPHKEFSMILKNDEIIDFAAFSGHKMFAPFGSGVLIASDKIFKGLPPFIQGGGTVEYVTKDFIGWKNNQALNEGGTPNIIGALSMASASKILKKTIYKKSEEQEELILKALIKRLKRNKKIKILGSESDEINFRLPVIPFIMEGINHYELADKLAQNYGIALRAGCFCAHIYVKRLLKVNKAEENKIINALKQNKSIEMPGAVRISAAFYNTLDEVNYLIQSLEEISSNL